MGKADGNIRRRSTKHDVRENANAAISNLYNYDDDRPILGTKFCPMTPYYMYTYSAQYISKWNLLDYKDRGPLWKIKVSDIVQDSLDPAAAGAGIPQDIKGFDIFNTGTNGYYIYLHYTVSAGGRGGGGGSSHGCIYSTLKKQIVVSTEPTVNVQSCFCCLNKLSNVLCMLYRNTGNRAVLMRYDPVHDIVATFQNSSAFEIDPADPAGVAYRFYPLFDQYNNEQYFVTGVYLRDNRRVDFKISFDPKTSTAINCDKTGTPLHIPARDIETANATSVDVDETNTFVVVAANASAMIYAMMTHREGVSSGVGGGGFISMPILVDGDGGGTRTVERIVSVEFVPSRFKDKLEFRNFEFLGYIPTDHAKIRNTQYDIAPAYKAKISKKVAAESDPHGSGDFQLVKIDKSRKLIKYVDDDDTLFGEEETAKHYYEIKLTHSFTISKKQPIPFIYTETPNSGDALGSLLSGSESESTQDDQMQSLWMHIIANYAYLKDQTPTSASAPPTSASASTASGDSSGYGDFQSIISLIKENTTDVIKNLCVIMSFFALNVIINNVPRDVQNEKNSLLHIAQIFITYVTNNGPSFPKILPPSSVQSREFTMKLTTAGYTQAEIADIKAFIAKFHRA